VIPTFSDDFFLSLSLTTQGLLSMKKEDKSQMVIDEACKEIMDWIVGASRQQ